MLISATVSNGQSASTPVLENALRVRQQDFNDVSQTQFRVYRCLSDVYNVSFNYLVSLSAARIKHLICSVILESQSRGAALGRVIGPSQWGFRRTLCGEEAGGPFEILARRPTPTLLRHCHSLNIFSLACLLSVLCSVRDKTFAVARKTYKVMFQYSFTGHLITLCLQYSVTKSRQREGE